MAKTTLAELQQNQLGLIQGAYQRHKEKLGIDIDVPWLAIPEHNLRGFVRFRPLQIAELLEIEEVRDHISDLETDEEDSPISTKAIEDGLRMAVHLPELLAKAATGIYLQQDNKTAVPLSEDDSPLPFTGANMGAILGLLGIGEELTPSGLIQELFNFVQIQTIFEQVVPKVEA